MYLDIASKEKDNIRDATGVVTATAGQGFLPNRALTPPS
jgi:hypothetical protein